MSEFLVEYEAIRRVPDPEASLLAFMQSTYDAGSTLAGWDRTALERSVATSTR